MRNDVEKAIKKYNVKTLGNKKNIERALDSLWNDEKVIYISPTNAVIKDVNTAKEKKLPGVFIFTNERIIFYYKILLDEKVEIFDISEVRAINCSGNGLTGGHIKVDTVVKSLDILVAYNKKIMKEMQDIFNKTVHDYKKSTSVMGTVQSPLSDADELRKYKGLLDDGIITQEEFEVKKKQLLGL